MSLVTADGLTLEHRWDLPQGRPRQAVVLCHPHPLQGGTMNVPFMRAVTASLLDQDLAVLRFNFRGVGGSPGYWGSGVGELHDVGAAVTEAIHTFGDLPIGLAGWSFGAFISLRWQARQRSTLAWVGVAPPLRLAECGDLPAPSELEGARRLLIIGDRDQFTDHQELAGYARLTGARLWLVEGTDHFFSLQERRIGSAIAAHLTGSDLDVQELGGVAP